MPDYQDYGFYSDGPTHNFSYQLNAIVKLIGKDKNRYILDLGCGRIPYFWMSMIIKAEL